MRPRERRQRVVHAGVLAALCVVIYWLGLGGWPRSVVGASQGTAGLHSTEAHRAIPGWVMLDAVRGGTGERAGGGIGGGRATLVDVLVPRMFEQAYLRKPPGMPWAVALSSSVLGMNAWGARAPSALAASAMVFVAYGFAWRWLRRRGDGDGLGHAVAARGALAAGLAQCLLPWMWSPGRAGEIEALNQLGVQLAALGVLDRFVMIGRREPHGGAAGHRTRPGAVIAPVSIAAGLFVLAAAKGPAGVPAVLGALAAGLIVERSWRRVRDAGLWAGLCVGLGLAGTLLALVAWAAGRVEAQGESVVVQSPGAFLFEAGRLVQVAALAPTALLFTLPASLALVFAWGPDARDEASEHAGARRARTLTTLCTVAAAVTLAVFTIAGTSNPRYALPAAVFAPVAAGAVWAWTLDGMRAHRVRIARMMCLGHPGAMLAALLVGWGVYVMTAERAERATTGEHSGRALGDAWAGTLHAGDVVAVDGLIEARPETLWSAQRRSAQLGVPVRVVWVPGLSRRAGAGELPQGCAAVVVRTDAGSDESAWADRALIGWELLANGSGDVHKFTFQTRLAPDGRRP